MKHGMQACTLVAVLALALHAESPNIVFVLADDMGYGDAGCNNPQARTTTPNLDRLAAEGMRFTDAHAPGSVCVPSRYGLMTGRYPARARMRPRDGAVLEADRATLASMLQGIGYTTAMVGKWHLGFDGGTVPRGEELMRGGPLDRGFASFFGIPASLDIPPYYYIRDRRPIALPSERIESSNTEGWSKIQGAFWRRGGIAPGFRHEEVLPRIREEATSFIDRQGELEGAAPFFLYVALPAPHTPWLPTERFRGKSKLGLYGDFVLQVDDLLGAILKTLEENGLARETLVFFSSDNGPVWYPADAERLDHRSAGRLRGMKGDAWEGGHRVPFVARWPGHVPAGSVSDATICFVDMMATLAALTAVELPAAAGQDSVDFLPVLLGEAEEQPSRTLILKADGSVFREGKWKLISHLGSGGFSKPRRIEPGEEDPPGQLYDLEDDPGETTNLWHEHREIAERLLAKLMRWRAQAGKR